MKVSATTVFLAAALGVAAHPSGHGHGNVHRSLEKRIDFVMNKKPDPPVQVKAEVVPTTTQAPPPPPKPTTQAAPAPKPTTSGGSSGSGGYKPFCGGSKKRATAAEIAYKGNTGTSGDYGCNLMMVDSAKGYQYTTTFENASGKDQVCVVWNKIGKDGGLTGFFKGNEALTFTLPSGGSKILAADSNSQVGASCGAGQVPTTTFGQFAGTWVEMDFGNESNNNWSGADASALVPAKYGLPITAMKICSGSQCSTVNAGGTGTNAYLGGMEAADGVGLNLPAGSVSLTVTVG